MANKNFRVRHGLEIGDGVSILDDGTTTGITTLTSVSNGNITLAPNGTGDVLLTADTVQVGDSNANATITTNGTGDLILNTNAGTNSGSITIADGANADITIATNGTGNVALSLSNGGNLTNTRNYVFGAIRNSTTDGLGDIWALNTTGTVQPFRGISIDNSSDTTKNSGYVARNYSNTAANRSRLIFERARGTAASPSAIQASDFLGEVCATGYSSTGWINDTLSVVPAFFGFIANENWTSNTNLGTIFSLSLAPSATTIASAANLVNTVRSTPEGLQLQGDVFSIARGKTKSFSATGCSTSGTTLTIGTLSSGTITVGQQIQTATGAYIAGTYIVANISGSGSGSTWTLSTSQTTSNQSVVGAQGFIGSPSAATTVDALADLRLLTNNLKGSGGTTQIVTSSAGATLELRGDNIQLEDAAGTSIKGGDISYRRTFGCWHKVADVTAAAADTVYNFDWTNNVTPHVSTQGITISNTSRINFDTAGDYNVIIEMVGKNVDNADRTAYVWLAKNGTDIAETAIKLVLTKDTTTMLAKDWLVDGIADNDYLEVRFAVDTTVSGISLEYTASQSSPYVRPAVPSATITITPVGA